MYSTQIRESSLISSFRAVFVRISNAHAIRWSECFGVSFVRFIHPSIDGQRNVRFMGSASRVQSNPREHGQHAGGCDGAASWDERGLRPSDPAHAAAA